MERRQRTKRTVICLDTTAEDDDQSGNGGDDSDDDYVPTPTKGKAATKTAKPRKTVKSTKAAAQVVEVIDLVQSPLVPITEQSSKLLAPARTKGIRKRKLVPDVTCMEPAVVLEDSSRVAAKVPATKRRANAPAAKRPKKEKPVMSGPDIPLEMNADTMQGDQKVSLLGKRGADDSAAGPSKKIKEEDASSKVAIGLPSSDEVIDVDAEWEARYGWKVDLAVSASVNARVDVVRNVVDMLQKDCTIPFIARYRREQTGGLQADELQNIQQTYQSLLSVKKKAQTMLAHLAKEKKGDATVKKLIISAKSLEELDHIFAPYKEAKGKSLAQRAKLLGLEDSANRILQGQTTVEALPPETLVKPEVKGLASANDVLLGWQHIIADFISKDRAVLDFLSNMSKSPGIMLTATKSSSAAKKAKEALTEGKQQDHADKKYDNYINFSRDVRAVQPYQVLAINRGESQKMLTVKVVLPPSFPVSVRNFCASRVREQGAKMYGGTLRLVESAVEDAYSRLLEPHLIRSIRSTLTKVAEQESVNVFRSNLRQLLLTPPVRGHAVLGIDPGFKHGCKLAAVSASGKLLQHSVIHPHASPASRYSAGNILRQLVVTHNCDLIALGNGTACRETEAFLSELISQRAFMPVPVKFCTIDESGASIYSVTKEAEAELPGLDPNIRSAVGIARRLQDPLLEYVKVEPKHLGVGMYQHDISESVLKNALEGVVVECVSFVGVDINVCPETILRKVSGLNAGTAKNIVEWRETHGPFKNRQQLLSVKRLGNKAFEQCAGFIKIFPETARATKGNGSSAPAQKQKSKKVSDEFDPLDMTIIHPESYRFAELLICHLKLKKEDIGKQHFIETVKRESSRLGVNHFVNILGGSVATMSLIVDALQQNVEYDIRSEQHQPLFKSGVVSLDEIEVGQELTGKVKNCTQFGAFVDIGVGKDGLIHCSQMNGHKVNLGDRVTVLVVNLERSRGRIGLRVIAKG